MSNQPPCKLDLEETELRLGLPGGANVNGKRGFEDTVDLKLNLSSNNNKLMEENIIKDKDAALSINIDQVKPPAKSQVVGWPPVRKLRKNIIRNGERGWKRGMEEGCGGLVKVSIDGAPYLRKVDLNMYKSYHQLSDALGKMFSSFTTESEAKGMIDFMSDNKLMDLLNSSEYVPTYEDKDGDWMLVGDVPWGMFVESCKRVRIMKGIEAAGLAPRAWKNARIEAEDKMC